MKTALALLLCTWATAAFAQCADCDNAFNQCVKGCFADSKCRRACEKTRGECGSECSPEQRKRMGAANAIGETEKECSGGDEKSCFALGRMYFQGRDVAQDYDKAAKYLETACRDGNADACGLLGEMYLQPYGLAQDITRGLSLMEKSCDRGSLEGCSVLGHVLSEGRHKARDLERAMKLWRDGCAKSHPASCTQLGQAHLLAKREPALALEKFDRGCSLGDGVGCEATCTVLLGENGVPRDEKRAFVACHKGCSDGHYLACAMEGLLLWHSDVVKPDAKKGKDLIESACEGGDAEACADLADALLIGSHGVKKNAEAAATSYLRAARRFEKQCNEKLEVRPCALWATLVARGKVPNKDPVRTRAMLEKGCTEGASIGCAGLGLMQEQAKDPPKALESYTLGCEGGKAEACFGAARLLEPTDAAKARGVYEKACGAWSGGACARLAELLKAEKAPAKEVKAMKARACRYGAVEACK